MAGFSLLQLKLRQLILLPLGYPNSQTPAEDDLTREMPRLAFHAQANSLALDYDDFNESHALLPAIFAITQLQLLNFDE